MTVPEIGAARFGIAVVAGMALGLFYGFLRPLRPKYTALADGIFLLGLYWGWVWWAFGVCEADPRPVGLFAMGLGAVGWELTVGRVLQPAYRHFWRVIGKLWDFLICPAKKFSKLQKFCLHLEKNGLQ